MKLITVLRHAKSSRDYKWLNDYERPLKKRGQSDSALVAGAYLTGGGGVPDRIISSPARRCVETVKIFCQIFRFPQEEISWDRELYLASAEFMLGKIQSEDMGNHLLIAGHNPGMSDLAEILTGRAFDKYPTCSMVTVSFDCDNWKDIPQTQGSEVCFLYPGMFKK